MDNRQPKLNKMQIKKNKANNKIKVLKKLK